MGQFNLFIVEWVKRYGQASPVYFKIWNWINGLLIFCGLVGSASTELGWIPKAGWETFLSHALVIAGGWGIAMSAQTVERKKADPILPFTANKEEADRVPLPLKSKNKNVKK